MWAGVMLMCGQFERVKNVLHLSGFSNGLLRLLRLYGIIQIPRLRPFTLLSRLPTTDC
jgi:hypothetical protein